MKSEFPGYDNELSRKAETPRRRPKGEERKSEACDLEMIDGRACSRFDDELAWVRMNVTLLLHASSGRENQPVRRPVRKSECNRCSGTLVSCSHLAQMEANSFYDAH
jgi:hypothetical protein